MLAGETPTPSPRRLNHESSLRWKRWKYEMDTYQRLQLEAQEVEAHAELRRAEHRKRFLLFGAPWHASSPPPAPHPPLTTPHNLTHHRAYTEPRRAA